jgi:hypothetical protein
MDTSNKNRMHINRLEIIRVIICFFLAVIWYLSFFIFFITVQIVFLVLPVFSVTLVFFCALWIDKRIMKLRDIRQATAKEITESNEL